MIRDRIVIGWTDSRLQQRLLREPELTLAKAVDICRSAEVTKEQLRDIAGTTSVHQVQSTHDKHTSSRKSCNSCLHYRGVEMRAQHSFCGNCGQNHPPKSCPACRQTCRACGKQNHFAKVCRTTRSQSSNRLYRTQAPDHSTSTASLSSSNVHTVQDGFDSLFVGHLHIDSCEQSVAKC